MQLIKHTGLPGGAESHEHMWKNMNTETEDGTLDIH
jgi:hypothetical protein